MNIGSGQVYKDASGNVGVGTATVGARFHVVTGATPQALIERTGSTVNTNIEYKNTSGSIFAGHGSANTFAVGTSANLSTAGNTFANFSADNVNFRTNSAERMRIDSAGNVVIGSTTSVGRLHVAGERIVVTGGNVSANLTVGGRTLDIAGVEAVSTSGRTGFVNRVPNDFNQLNNNAGFQHLYPHGGTLDGYAFRAAIGTTLSDTFWVKQRGDAFFNGNVGIGTTSPTQKLHVNGGVLIQGTNQINFFDTGYFVRANTGFEFQAADLIRFSTSGANERMRIDASGNVLVGQTSATAPGLTNTVNGHATRPQEAAFHSVSENFALGVNRNTSDGSVVRIGREGVSVGTISVTTTATTYNTSSDVRLKDNIIDSPSASDSIDAVKIRSFDWKVDGSHQKYGVIAQELEAVAPEAVSKGEKEDDMWAVDYSKLVPMLIKEVQSLRARVAQLEGN
jgi:hypothetical protein